MKKLPKLDDTFAQVYCGTWFGGLGMVKSDISVPMEQIDGKQGLIADQDGPYGIILAPSRELVIQIEEEAGIQP